MNTEIITKIKSYLVEVSEKEITADDITLESTLTGDLDLDSLQSVSMVLDLEDFYSITIDEDEIMTLKTIGDVVNLIVRKKEQAGE